MTFLVTFMWYSNCLLCSAVDYGGTQVVAGDAIKSVVDTCTPRETMRELATTTETNRPVMLNFFARYAVCALPKEGTRKILNAYAAKRWEETRSLPDTIENRDAEHHFKCILDLMTASDIAYILWQYVNSYEDWCNKLSLLKEGKSVNMNKSEAEWTSDHKKAPMESRVETDEGVRFYNSCLDWSRGLKKLGKASNGGPTDDYVKMRVELNKRMVASGIIKDPSVQKKTGATGSRKKRVECVDAGGFQLEDVDELPTGIDVYAI